MKRLSCGYKAAMSVAEFEAAAEAVKKFSKKPTDAELLEIYALFKQASRWCFCADFLAVVVVLPSLPPGLAVPGIVTHQIDVHDGP